MADVSQIKVNNTTYNLKDNNAVKGFTVGGSPLTIDANKNAILPLGNGLIMESGYLSVTNAPTDLYGVKLNWGTSAPASIVSYSQLAASVTPATTYNGTSHRDTDYKGGWEDGNTWIFDERQRYYCVLHNIDSATAEGDLDLVGTEAYKLDSTDITKKKDGTSAVLDGSEGDVMVCRKFMYDKYIKGEGNEDELLFSPDMKKGARDWYARAFEFEGTIRDRVYVGVCIANKDANNRLRSGFGLTPTGNITIGNAETYATNNNPSGKTGYTQYNVNLYDMYQKLFWLKYKSTDSQTALGYGYCDTAEGDARPDDCGHSFNAAHTYGGKASGYDYGLKTGVHNAASTDGKKVHMRFDGIEDLWGNMVVWCKGVTVQNLNRDGTEHYWVVRAGGNAENPNPANWAEATKRFTPTEYTENKWGYFGAVSRDGGIDPVQPVSFTGGSSSAKLCDGGSLCSGNVADAGGSWAAGTSAGVSRLAVDYGLSGAAAILGARLVYYPPDLAGE